MPLGAAGSFCPGSPNQKISTYPTFLDAADGLLNDTELYPQANGPGILLTADGGRYEGDLFGAEKIGEGELVFTTCLLYTSPSPRDLSTSRMPSSA